MTRSKSRFTSLSSAFVWGRRDVTDGKVRLRSNIVTDGSAWREVPGEVVGQLRPHLLRLPHRPSQIQIDEKMYYTPCGVCGRTIHAISLEGCERCAHGPRPAQLTRNRAGHERAILALERARAELAEQIAVAETQPDQDSRTPVRDSTPAAEPEPTALPVAEVNVGSGIPCEAAIARPPDKPPVPRSFLDRLLEFVERLLTAIRRFR
jgi:hypothetical protein